MKNILLVGIGGFIGSVARYLLGLASQSWFQGVYPLGTLTVNLVGSLLIGILAGYLIKSHHITAQLILITGFCGGFTTFSTFSLEGLKILQNGAIGLYIAYALASLIGGLGLCLLGFWLTKNFIS